MTNGASVVATLVKTLQTIKTHSEAVEMKYPIDALFDVHGARSTTDKAATIPADRLHSKQGGFVDGVIAATRH